MISSRKFLRSINCFVGRSDVGEKQGVANSAEVFRQFAWNLAGTLAKPVRRVSKARPAGAVKR